MPRTIEVSAPAAMAETILQRVREVDGVVGLTHVRGAAIQPPGDLLSIQTTNDGARAVIDLLDELEVLPEGSIITSEPRSIISPRHQQLIDRESNESIWDEMAFLLRADTNFAPNFLALMFLAGAIAGVGLWSDTLHLVIGSMVIAPAFEPLVRIPFGLLVGGRRMARDGIASTAAGYTALIIGGLAALLVLRVVDPAASSDLASREWVRFWSTFTAPGVVVSTLAAAAGAIVISGQRSVLTTGVMIALALVPSLCIVGMALGVGDFGLAGRGLLRWSVDAALVVMISGIVLVVKRKYLRRHRALS